MTDARENSCADLQATDFALTMTIRRYQWQTERARDQTHFLNSVVKVYRTYTKGEIPELINWNPPPSSATMIPPNGGKLLVGASPRKSLYQVWANDDLPRVLPRDHLFPILPTLHHHKPSRQPVRPHPHRLRAPKVRGTKARRPLNRPI